jgi:toluene monooxygenase system protein D
LPKLPGNGVEVNEEQAKVYDHVGPVLQMGALSEAIVAAIKDLNTDVAVIDRGGYLRVLVPHRCIVTRSAIEKYLGRSVRFPGELETVMSAFKGTLKLTGDEAVWQFKRMSDAKEH